MDKSVYFKYNLKIKNSVRIAISTVLWILTALCCVGIFMFSQQSGDESQQLSDGLLGFLLNLLGPLINSFIVRKFAHFFEFLVLAFCVSGALFFTKKRFLPVVAFIAGALYAVSDEVHQYFVPERACRVFDVFVDSCGVLTGILIFMGLLALVNFIVLKKRSK
jgi:VanZ family protein